MMHQDLVTTRKCIQEDEQFMPYFVSTNLSIRGSGKQSFRQALLRSLKSTYTRYFPLFLGRLQLCPTNQGSALVLCILPQEACTLLRLLPRFSQL